MMKIFVTGATGLLGTHVVQILLQQQHQVKALVRSADKGRAILGQHIELVEGDMLAIDKFSEQLMHMDVLIHAAAYFTDFFKHGNASNQLTTINVQGTLALLNAAYEHGIRNCVYISSSGVLKMEGRQRATETAPYNEQTVNPYFQSKISAEKEIIRFLEAHADFRLIFILPCLMLGPGDHNLTEGGGLIVRLLKRKIPMILPGQMAIADARDVAQAVINAIKAGQSGKRYLLGGELYTIEKVFAVVSEVSGIKGPTHKPTPGLLLLMADIMEFISKFTGKKPLIQRIQLKTMMENMGYDSSKAQRELHATFRPLHMTVKDTVQWFRENGYV